MVTNPCKPLQHFFPQVLLLKTALQNWLHLSHPNECMNFMLNWWFHAALYFRMTRVGPRFNQMSSTAALCPPSNRENMEPKLLFSTPVHYLESTHHIRCTPQIFVCFVYDEFVKVEPSTCRPCHSCAAYWKGNRTVSGTFHSLTLQLAWILEDSFSASLKLASFIHWVSMWSEWSSITYKAQSNWTGGSLIQPSICPYCLISWQNGMTKKKSKD